MDKKERVQGLKLRLEYIPKTADHWDVVRAVAKILHSEDFPVKLDDDRLLNFKITLDESESGGFQHEGTGYLILGEESVGRKALQFFRDHPLKIKGQKIRVYPKAKAFHNEALQLQRTPYTDPDIEQQHEEIDRELRDELRVDVVQFGALYTDRYPRSEREPPSLRSYSIEWQRDYRKISAAWLKFEYNHKLIRVIVSQDDCYTV
jgi:RNA-dependent RNA polymerase